MKAACPSSFHGRGESLIEIFPRETIYDISRRVLCALISGFRGEGRDSGHDPLYLDFSSGGLRLMKKILD